MTCSLRSSRSLISSASLRRYDLLAAGLLKFLPHVDNLDFRQGPLFHSVGQFEQLVFALLGVEVRLQRRCGRSQHYGCVRHFGPHHRHISGVIARHFLLLVRGVLLLVHDDQGQIRDRSEHAGTRAYHHASVSPLNAMPLLRSFLVGQCRMQDGHSISEQLMQVGSHRWSQTNLRNKQDGERPASSTARIAER